MANQNIALNFSTNARLVGRQISTMGTALEEVSKEFRNAEIGSSRFFQSAKKINILEADIKEAKKALNNFGKEQGRASASIAANIKAAVAGFATIGGAAALAGSVIRSALGRVESERRLEILASGYGEVAELQEIAANSAKLFGQAQTEANQSIANIYARLRPLGVSLDDIASTYNGFNTAARLSGASAQETSAAFTQLAQALGSGVLRGEEFNSIAEQAPGLLQAISKELNVSTGELRDYAADGKITSDIVIRALKSIEEDGAKSLEKAMDGPQQKLKNLQNEVDNLNAKIGKLALPSLIALVEDFTNALKDAVDQMDALGSAASLTYQAVRPLADAIAYFVEAGGGIPGMMQNAINSLVPFGRQLTTLTEIARQFMNITGLTAQIEMETARQGQNAGMESVGIPTWNPVTQQYEYDEPIKRNELPRVTPKDAKKKVGGGSGRSGGGRKITDISADRLELSKRLFAAQEAENQVAIVNLQTALSVLDAEENIEGVNKRQRAILEALSKQRLDLKKIAEDDAKEQKRADEEKRRRQEEINRAVQEYKALLVDAQEATGAISPDEASQRRRDAEQLQTIERLRGILPPGEIENLKLAFEAIPKVGSIGEAIVELKRDLEELTNPVNMLMTSAQGIGDAFADAFSSIITGASSARESLGQFFGNVGKMFADMATRIITQWMVMKAVGLVGSLFPKSSPTPGGSGGSGIPFLTNLGADAGSYRPIGIPLTPYANGGVVTGPTMGLIGEGRFNEAVVPLPNGKSIPVDLGGGTGGDIATSIVVNVNNGQASSSMKGNQGNQLAKNIEGAVKEVIMRETRPGGIIYSSRQ